MTWVNIAASNNRWSNGVTRAHLKAIADAAPHVQVFDVPLGDLIGSVREYELRADGQELWGNCDLERQPLGKYHGEAVLIRNPDGRVDLGMVALTTQPRGAIQQWLARRYPGRVGNL